MTRKEMLSMSLGKCHQCAPRQWRGLPDLTGDYDLDATILHRPNRDLPHRLALYTRRSPSFGGLTGYSAYRNYGGDT